LCTTLPQLILTTTKKRIAAAEVVREVSLIVYDEIHYLRDKVRAGAHLD